MIISHIKTATGVVTEHVALSLSNLLRDKKDFTVVVDLHTTTVPVEFVGGRLIKQAEASVINLIRSELNKLH